MKLHPRKIFIHGLAWLLLIAFPVNSLALPIEGTFETGKRNSFERDFFSSKVPVDWGMEIESVPSRALNAPSVFYIQDAHCLYEAQKNISRLITFLTEKIREKDKTRPVLIAVEGQSGKVDVETFRRMKDAVIRRRAADFYMKKGLLSGAEYAALDLPGKVTLMGVEQKSSYEENRALYLEAQGVQKKALRFLGVLKNNLETLKRETYSPLLLEMDQKEELFQSEKLGLLDYFRFLMGFERSREWITDYQDLNRLSEARILERSFDVRRSEEEAKEVLDRLKGPLHQEAYQTLTLKWLRGNRSGSYAQFYSFLFERLKSLGWSLDAYPALKNYAEYLKITEEIEGPRLFEELESLTRRLKEGFLSTDKQREIAAQSGRLRVFEKLIRLEVSRKDYGTALLAKEQTKIPVKLAGFLEPAFAFYQKAIERDEVLFHQLESLLPSNSGTGSPIVFLITGGFHTEGLKTLMKEKGIGYRLVSPRIAHGTENNPYEELINGYESPLAPIAEAFQNDPAEALRGENKKKIQLSSGREVFYRFRAHRNALDVPQKRSGKIHLIDVDYSSAPFLEQAAQEETPDSQWELLLKKAIATNDFQSFQSVMKNVAPLPAAPGEKEGIETLNERFLRNVFELLTTLTEDKRQKFVEALESFESDAMEDLLKRSFLGEMEKRIQTILSRKQKLFEALPRSGQSIEELANILRTISRQEIAIPGFLSGPRERFEFEIALSKLTEPAASAASIGKELRSINGEDAIVFQPKALQAMLEEREWVHETHHKWVPSVVIFGSARIFPGHPEYDLSVALGRKLYKKFSPLIKGGHPISLRTGAGPSMMEGPMKGWTEQRVASGDEVTEENKTQGIKIYLNFEAQYNDYVEHRREFNRFLTRKLGLHENTVGAIAMHGGFGTIDEVFEVWRRDRPLVLLGTEFWQPIIDTLKKSWEAAGISDRVFTYPLVTDSMTEAVDAMIQEPSQRGYIVKTEKADLDRLNGELEGAIGKLSKLPRSIVFFGRPNEHSRELKIAGELGKLLLENNIPLRVASRHELFSTMYRAAKETGKVDSLQATLELSTRDRDKDLTPEEASLKESNLITVADDSNHQVLGLKNSNAMVFLPGGISTMNRLWDVIQLLQTKKIRRRPLILVGKDFWQPIFDTIIRQTLTYDPPLISPEDAGLFQIVDSVEEALSALAPLAPIFLSNGRNGNGSGSSLGKDEEVTASSAGLVKGNNGEDAVLFQPKVLQELLEERKQVHEIHTRWAPAVVVFGSARIPEKHPEYDFSVTLGKRLYKEFAPYILKGYPISLRTGAGPSMMEGPLRGWVEKRRSMKHEVTEANMTQGIRIWLPFENKYNDFVEDHRHEFQHFITRKMGLHENSVGAIAVHGGFGTIDEVFEVWRRDRSLVLLGTDFWQPIVDALKTGWEGAGLADRIWTYPIVTDSASEAVQAMMKDPAQEHYIFKTDKDELERVNEELKTAMAQLSHLPRSIVFVGRPNEKSKELAIAGDLTKILMQNDIPVRVVSRHELFDRMHRSALEVGKLEQLQASILLSSRDDSPILTSLEKSLKPENLIAVKDDSNHQILGTKNSNAFVFLPGGVSTMNRLWDIIQILQTKKIRRRPLILVGKKFWQPIFDAIIRQTLTYNPPLIAPQDAGIVQIVDSLDEALYHLSAFAPLNGYGSSLGTEKAFLGKGEAVKEAANVEKEPVQAAALEPFLKEMDKAFNALWKKNSAEKMIGQRVLAHLRSLLAQQKIFGFEELRWSESSYLLAFADRESVAVGQGFWRPKGFSDYQLAALLFEMGLKSLASDPAQNLQEFLGDEKAETIMNLIFHKNKLKAKLESFVKLDDFVFLDGALEQFSALTDGSPYFETLTLLQAWIEADAKGESVPALKQAQYLMDKVMKYFPNLLSVLGGELITNRELANLPREADKQEEFIATFYLKVLIPIASFHLASGQMLSNASKAYKDVEGAVRNAKHLTPSQRVREEDVKAELLSGRVSLNKPMILYIANPKPFSPTGDQELFRTYQKLVLAAVARGEKWLNEQLSRYDNRANPVTWPGMPHLPNDTLIDAIPYLFNYNVKGWLAYQEKNPSTGGLTWFGMARHPQIEAREGVRIETFDYQAPLGSMRMEYRNITYHTMADGGVLIYRHKQPLMSDLLGWLNRAPITLSTSKADIEKLMPVLAGIRKNLTAKSETPGLFAPDGVDPEPWLESILKLQALSDMNYWIQAKTFYGSLDGFLERSSQDKKLLWYYTLFAKRDGLFAWLSERLEYEKKNSHETSRLTQTAAKDLLDTLMALYWSGPSRKDRGEVAAFLFNEIFRYIRFSTEGVTVSDKDGFKKFLTQDLGRAMTEQEMTRWAAQRFSGSMSEDDLIIPPLSQIEPLPGTAVVLPASNGSSYYSEAIPPSDILWPSRWPKTLDTAPALAVYSGVYQNGLVIPAGIPFRYMISGVADGTPLRVEVTHSRFSIKRQKGEPPLVDIELSKAQSPYGDFGNNWQRIPKDASVKTLPGFYETPVAADGLVFVRLGERLLSLQASYFAGKSFLVQVVGDNLVLYHADDLSYAGKITSDNQLILRNNENKIVIFPPLPEIARNNHFYTVKQRNELYALAQKLEPLISSGLGYKQLILSSETDIRIVEERVYIPEKYLVQPDLAVIDLKNYLEIHDPLAKLQARVQKLRDFSTTDLLNSHMPFPESLPSEPADVVETWSERAQKEYRQSFNEMESRQQTLAIIRNVLVFLSGQKLLSFPDQWRAMLGRLMSEGPEDFFFVSRGGKKTFANIQSFMRADGNLYDHEGVAYLTNEFYSVDETGQVTMESRPRALTSKDTISRPLIAVRMKVPEKGNGSNGKKGKKEEEKFVLYLFDPDTGEAFSQELNQREKAMNKLYRLVPALADDGELKKELLDALRRSGDIRQQTVFLEELNALFEPALRSELKEVNEAVARIVLGMISRGGGIAKAKSLVDPWQHQSGGITEQIELLLLSLDLHPSESGKETNYAVHVNDFIRQVLVSVVVSGWEGAPDVSSSYYFEQLIAHLVSVKERVEAVWNLGNASVTDASHWDGPWAFRFALVNREDAAPGPIHRYFLGILQEMQRLREIESEPVTEEEIKISKLERKERATHYTFYGGVQGIGASSAALEHKGTSILVDAGVYLDESNRPPAYRLIQNIPQAVFLTHSHLDHIGSAVFLFKHFQKAGATVPFYTTSETKRLLAIILRNMIRDMARREDFGRSFAQPLWSETELADFLENLRTIDPVGKDEEGFPVYPVVSVGPTMKVQFHHAGHLHGAVSLIVMTPDGNTFVSGDISVHPQGRVKGMRKWPLQVPIHTAIMESTYGTLERVSEEAQEEALVKSTLDALARRGKVLFPVFANGRAQRILDILLRNQDRLPKNARIFVDGQAAVFTGEYQKDFPQLKSDLVTLLDQGAREEYRLRKIISRPVPTIIIASSGNLSYGVSRWYGEKLVGDTSHENAIFFTGYMDPIETGSKLLNAKQGDLFRMSPGEDPVHVTAQVKTFKLPGHLSWEESLGILHSFDEAGKAVNGKPSLNRVIFVHGSHKAREEVITSAREANADWNPGQVRVGERVSGVVTNKNKEWFDAQVAQPIDVYQAPGASSLGEAVNPSLVRLFFEEFTTGRQKEEVFESLRNVGYVYPEDHIRYIRAYFIDRKGYAEIDAGKEDLVKAYISGDIRKLSAHPQVIQLRDQLKKLLSLLVANQEISEVQKNAFEASYGLESNEAHTVKEAFELFNRGKEKDAQISKDAFINARDYAVLKIQEWLDLPVTKPVVSPEEEGYWIQALSALSAENLGTVKKELLQISLQEEKKIPASPITEQDLNVFELRFGAEKLGPKGIEKKLSVSASEVRHSLLKLFYYLMRDLSERTAEGHWELKGVSSVEVKPAQLASETVRFILEKGLLTDAEFEKVMSQPANERYTKMRSTVQFARDKEVLRLYFREGKLSGEIVTMSGQPGSTLPKINAQSTVTNILQVWIERLREDALLARKYGQIAEALQTLSAIHSELVDVLKHRYGLAGEIPLSSPALMEKLGIGEGAMSYRLQKGIEELKKVLPELEEKSAAETVKTSSDTVLDEKWRELTDARDAYAAALKETKRIELLFEVLKKTKDQTAADFLVELEPVLAALSEKKNSLDELAGTRRDIRKVQLKMDLLIERLNDIKNTFPREAEKKDEMVSQPEEGAQIENQEKTAAQELKKTIETELVTLEAGYSGYETQTEAVLRPLYRDLLAKLGSYGEKQTGLKNTSRPEEIKELIMAVGTLVDKVRVMAVNVEKRLKDLESLEEKKRTDEKALRDFSRELSELLRKHERSISDLFVRSRLKEAQTFLAQLALLVDQTKKRSAELRSVKGGSDIQRIQKEIPGLIDELIALKVSVENLVQRLTSEGESEEPEAEEALPAPVLKAHSPVVKKETKPAVEKKKRREETVPSPSKPVKPVTSPTAAAASTIKPTDSKELRDAKYAAQALRILAMRDEEKFLKGLESFVQKAEKINEAVPEEKAMEIFGTFDSAIRALRKITNNQLQSRTSEAILKARTKLVEILLDDEDYDEDSGSSLGEVPMLLLDPANTDLTGRDSERFARLFINTVRKNGLKRTQESIERYVNAYVDALKLQETEDKFLDERIQNVVSGLNEILFAAGSLKTKQVRLDRFIGEMFSDTEDPLKEELARFLSSLAQWIEKGMTLMPELDLKKNRAAIPGDWLSRIVSPDRAGTFLQESIPQEPHLAIIFGISTQGTAFSLHSEVYREAIKMILSRNPLAMIRVIHLGNEAAIGRYRREFAVYGSRFKIEAGDTEHAPYLLAGLLNDSLVNEVKSLSGQKDFKKTQLPQYLSVVAEGDLLDQFRKVALGGKELVSLVHSKALAEKKNSLKRGAVLLEWTLAHSIAFQSVSEIRQQLSDQELAIRGNRFIPNINNLLGLLNALSETMEAIRSLARSA